MSFQIGDLVVHPKFGDKKIYEICEISGDLFTVFCGRKSHSFRTDVRHATPEEIAAGHRIDELSGNSEKLEVLDIIDISTKTQVIEQ